MPANVRYRRRNCESRYPGTLGPDHSFARYAIFDGRELIRAPGTTDLRDDLEEWADVWERHRHYLLPDWIKVRPGERPAVWWAVDYPNLPKRRPGEIRVEYLWRTGQIDQDELRGLWDYLLDTVNHNNNHDIWARRDGTSSNQRFRGQDIDEPYSELHLFSAEHPPDDATYEERALIAALDPNVLVIQTIQLEDD
jgi:hypothetical protein